MPLPLAPTVPTPPSAFGPSEFPPLEEHPPNQASEAPSDTTANTIFP